MVLLNVNDTITALGNGKRWTNNALNNYLLVNDKYDTNCETIQLKKIQKYKQDEDEKKC